MNATEAALQALEPYRASIEKRVAENLNAYVRRLYNFLAVAGWDAQAAFPYPSSSLRRQDYQPRLADYKAARQWTTTPPDAPRRISHTAPEPRLPLPEPVLQETINSLAFTEAAGVIASYAAKLAAKQKEQMEPGEEITAAEYTGSLWDHSLMIFRTTGVRKNYFWQTKCIINRSSLGKLFNQFPTRLAK